MACKLVEFDEIASCSSPKLAVWRTSDPLLALPRCLHHLTSCLGAWPVRCAPPHQPKKERGAPIRPTARSVLGPQRGSFPFWLRFHFPPTNIITTSTAFIADSL